MAVTELSIERLDQLEKLGRYPNTLTREENILSGWVARCRRELRLGTLDAYIEAELDRVLPEWRTPPGRREHSIDWVARAKQIAAFRDEHGRTPRTGGKDLSAEEKQMGGWLRNMRQMRKTQYMDDKLAASITEVLPGWETSTYKRAKKGARITLSDRVSVLEAEVRELRQVVEELKEAMSTRK